MAVGCLKDGTEAVRRPLLWTRGLLSWVSFGTELGFVPGQLAAAGIILNGNEFYRFGGVQNPSDVDGIGQ